MVPDKKWPICIYCYNQANQSLTPNSIIQPRMIIYTMVDLQLQLSLVHSNSPWSRIEPRPGPEKPSSRLGHYHDQTCKMFLRFVVFLIWPEYIKLCSVYFNLVSNQYSDDKLERCQLLISSALFWRRSASPGLRLVSLFWFACHLNHNSISTGSARESTPLQAESNTVVDCIDWA